MQPKRQHIDVDTKVLARSCLDRVYETASMKEQAGEDIKKESRRLEKTSGSKDSPNYQDDPGATHEPKGKRGRPSKSKHTKTNRTRTKGTVIIKSTCHRNRSIAINI